MQIFRCGEQTVIDGEHTIHFYKKGRVPRAAISIQTDGIAPVTLRNFYVVGLSGHPIKDCWTLLRWYFSGDQ